MLDTHAILWALADDDRLSPAARDLVENLDDDLLVSAVSAWEIAVKVALGKLEIPEGFEAAVQEAGFVNRVISFLDDEILRALPLHHRDPFDRILVAQALADRLPIITKDLPMANYPVQTIW